MTIDLTGILANLAQSLLSIETLIEGAGYVLGILFVITGILKLTKSNFAHEGAGEPIAYILGGAVLIYLPSSVYVVSNTFFGSNNILQYTNYSNFNLYDSIGIFVKTAGLLWFVRGAVLLAHASAPGKQEGLKGLLFVIAGVLSMNFSFTVGAINSIFAYFSLMASQL